MPLPARPGASLAEAGATFGVVGLGRMALALLLPLLDAGLIEPAAVRAAVASSSSAQRLREAHGFAVDTDASEAWLAPVVVLAVKPQQLDQVALQAGAARNPQASPSSSSRAAEAPLLISVLAGVRLERLQRLFPEWRCVRAVPNTPCLVRAGLTGLAWGEGIDPERRQWVQTLFAQVGEVLELPEAQLDAFLALTSSGPAFVAVMAEALADGAVAAGLPRALAHHLTHRTLAGCAALLHEQALHPAQLKDMVSSPAGTTIAGLRQLERAGVRSALIEAVVAAAVRSRELA